MLRSFYIPTSPSDEITDEIVHITSDIAGLAEFGGICFHKGNPNQIGCGADEVGLAYASGSQD